VTEAVRAAQDRTMETVGVAGSDLGPSGTRMNETRPDQTIDTKTFLYDASTAYRWHLLVSLCQMKCWHSTYNSLYLGPNFHRVI